MEHFKVSPQKKLINYREKKSNFKMQKFDRHHHKLVEGYMGVPWYMLASYF